MNNLGKILKHIRVFNHYKQEELSKKLNVSRYYISEIEGGSRTPSQEILIKYAEFAEIPLSAII